MVSTEDFLKCCVGLQNKKVIYSKDSVLTTIGLQVIVMAIGHKCKIKNCSYC